MQGRPSKLSGPLLDLPANVGVGGRNVRQAIQEGFEIQLTATHQYGCPLPFANDSDRLPGILSKLGGAVGLIGLPYRHQMVGVFRPGCAYIEAPVDQGRIHRYQLAVQPLGQGDGEIGLPGRRRTHDAKQGRRRQSPTPQE